MKHMSARVSAIAQARWPVVPGGQHDAARDRAAFDRPEVEQVLGDRSSERTGEVVGLFGPVDAVPQGAGRTQQSRIDAPGGEAGRTRLRQPIAVAGARRGEPVSRPTGMATTVTADDPALV